MILVKNKKTIIVVLIAVFSTICSVAQDLEPTEIVKEFFIKYEKDGTDKALNYLFSTNHWMEQRSKDGVSNIKVKLNSFIDLVGDYYGYEYVTEKSIGQSFRLYSYLVKYDRQPIRFVFIFYKPNDKWMIYNFKYDQELTEELEDAAKAYRLKENFDF